MRIKTIGKVGFVVVLVGLVLFTLGGAAFATTGQNGPIPPQLGDPVGTNVAPHGGFSSSTDFCVQCHSVHNTTDTSAGAYALLWKSSVTATCNTCHGLAAYGGAATGRRDSNAETGFTGGIMGTTSSRSAYDITVGVKASHPLNATSTNGTGDMVPMQTSGWSYHGSPATWATNVQDTDGLQCTSCHTAHGNWGALINSERGVIRTTANGADINTPSTWADGAAIYQGATLKYLNIGGDGVWESCTDAAGTAGCVDLTTTDSEGQTVYLYGYKMLSAYPNFNWDGLGESWGVDMRNHDQARWCGSCHTRHVPSEFGTAFTYHNHPTGCTACHGNPSNDVTSRDFPHTSTFGNFLASYPDGLCIGSCHTAGSLP